MLSVEKTINKSLRCISDNSRKQRFFNSLLRSTCTNELDVSDLTSYFSNECIQTNILFVDDSSILDKLYKPFPEGSKFLLTKKFIDVVKNNKKNFRFSDGSYVNVIDFWDSICNLVLAKPYLPIVIEGQKREPDLVIRFDISGCSSGGQPNFKLLSSLVEKATSLALSFEESVELAKKNRSISIAPVGLYNLLTSIKKTDKRDCSFFLNTLLDIISIINEGEIRSYNKRIDRKILRGRENNLSATSVFLDGLLNNHSISEQIIVQSNLQDYFNFNIPVFLSFEKPPTANQLNNVLMRVISNGLGGFKIV